jgi:hypothetical protein
VILLPRCQGETVAERAVGGPAMLL